MNVIIELTKEDIQNLSSKKELKFNSIIKYEENKIDDLALFMKLAKETR